MQTVGYHGGTATLATRDPRRPLWVALDREYAEGYAEAAGGEVAEVDLAGLHVLDLRHLGTASDAAAWDEDLGCLVDPETDAALAEALAAAGVGAEDLGAGEMHQRVRVLAAALVAAGWDAVAIQEWTDGVGESDTVCVLAR